MFIYSFIIIIITCIAVVIIAFGFFRIDFVGGSQLTFCSQRTLHLRFFLTTYLVRFFLITTFCAFSHTHTGPQGGGGLHHPRAAEEHTRHHSVPGAPVRFPRRFLHLR